MPSLDLIHLSTVPPLARVRAASKNWGQAGGAFNGDVQFAVNHSLEGCFFAIDGDDLDIGTRFLAGFFNSLDSAQGHFIIVGVDTVDLVAVFLDQSLGNFFALGQVEVTGLEFRMVISL